MAMAVRSLSVIPTEMSRPLLSQVPHVEDHRGREANDRNRPADPVVSIDMAPTPQRGNRTDVGVPDGLALAVNDLGAGQVADILPWSSRRYPEIRPAQVESPDRTLPGRRLSST